jgi:hypothetical protein
MSLEGGAGADGAVALGDNSDPKGQQTTVTDDNSGGEPKKSEGSTWLDGLDKDNREYAEKKGWKDLNAQLKSHRELEIAFSKKSSKSDGQKPAGEEGSQPSIPARAEDYEFKLPEKFPTDGFYDKAFADTFKGWAHKAKLSTEQAQALHDMYVTNMAELVGAHQTKTAEQFNASVNDAFKTLTKEWGSADAEGFKRNVELGRRAIANLDPSLKDALVSRGVIATNAKGQEVVVDATIFKALAKVGGRLYAEDELYSAPAAKENPFDPKKPNLQKQGELIQTNPELAKSLIEASGNSDWTWWVHKNFPKK